MKRLSKLVFDRLPATNTATKAVGVSHNSLDTCELHDQTKYPNLRSIEYCRTCSIGMWYMWGNEHFDKHHIVDWGYDIFKYMEAPHGVDNELFNSGYRVILDLDDIKCPCGM